MARSRLLAALALVLALALPGAALADGAGDNQYQDPFGTSQPQKSPPKKTKPQPTQTAPTTTAPPPASVSPSATSTTPSTATPAPTASTDPAGAQLPRTGLDLRLPAGIGVLLVAGGLVLRRRLS
jgi:hypothetical protein